MIRLPYNPRMLKKELRATLTSIATNVYGKLQVTSPLRNPVEAWANFRGSGTSGAPRVNVMGVSGVTAVVEFYAYSGTLVGPGSTTGYSGGTLECWFRGD